MNRWGSRPWTLLLAGVAWVLGSAIFPERAASQATQATLEWPVGIVEEGRVYETILEIPNPSDQPLILEQARSSCGCLDVQVLKARAAPGEAAQIRLTLDTTGLEPSFRKFAYVRTNQPERRFLRVSVTGRLKSDPSERPLEIQFYYDPADPRVPQVQEMLDALRGRYGSRVRVVSFDMTVVEHYRRLYQLEDRLGITQVAPLEVFVGDLYLGGWDAIRGRLSGLVEALLEGDAAQEVAQGSAPVEVHLFYTPGCRECREAKAFLREAQRRLREADPPLRFVLRLHDISQPDEYARLVALEEAGGRVSRAPVSVWVGQTQLAGLRAIQNGFEDALRQAVTSPIPASDRHALLRRFRSFSVGAVLGAGLLDGVNPCAFTTLIFFLSMLSLSGRQRRDLLLVGSLFALAVFITYLLIGLGIFHAVQALEGYTVAAMILTYVAGGLALVLAATSLYDALVYARTRRGRDLKLQLPLRVKQRIHRLIRENLRSRHLALAAFVIGVGVSGLESICTGQVYLPTITLVTRDPTLRLHAYGYLVLYNLMFLTPLLGVFGLAYLGVSSQKIGAFSQRHLVATRLLTAGLFVALAALVLTT